jgi:hemerythrin
MPLITWTSDNSVGVKEFDAQHQKIFFLVNNLYDLMTQSKAQTEIDKVLSELADYAKYHFQAEEKYFAMFNYEGKDGHVLQHEAYKEKIGRFIDESKKEEGVVLSYDILDFLEDWWLNHINIEDKKYTQCFNSHGLH